MKLFSATLAVMGAASVSAFVGTPITSSFTGAPVQIIQSADAIRMPLRTAVTMDGKSNAIRDRIKTVKNTKKITSAMQLVAAAKVRRAQDAVLRTRPFSETLQSLFGALIEQMGKEDIQLPLLEPREVKTVLTVAISGDRGLCGAYNSYAIKKAEARAKEVMSKGVKSELVTVGKKVTQYFRRREDRYTVKRSFDCGQSPNADEAGAIAEELLADFLSGDADSVELIYTRFVSLIASEPSIRTLLPLQPRGIENEEDEIFNLTTKDGKFTVEREGLPAAEKTSFEQDLIFEQDPVQILNGLLPLYLDGQILRTLQESVASELASRMQAMQSATDNASDLAKRLSLVYNRARQAAVTQELLEIVAGANALSDE